MESGLDQANFTAAVSLNTCRTAEAVLALKRHQSESSENGFAIDNGRKVFDGLLRPSRRLNCLVCVGYNVHLSNLLLNKLKIDQSFIRKMADSPSSRSITEAIIGLGRTLNLKVVGEGIESEEAMEFLRDHGCDQAQACLAGPCLPTSLCSGVEIARSINELLEMQSFSLVSLLIARPELDLVS